MESEIWYYPVPLADVKGLTLDIKSNARSTVTLQVKRPWWAAVIMAVGTSGVIWATFHAYFYPIYMEYLNPNARAHEYDPGGADLSIYILVCVIGFWIWAAGMAFFLFKKRLWHSKKKPWQLQERQIRLGILDPITRATSVFYCNMEDDYSLTSAQTFIRHLQQHAPQLHFGSLASTHVSAQLRQQSTRHDVCTETDLKGQVPEWEPEEEETITKKTVAQTMLLGPLNGLGSAGDALGSVGAKVLEGALFKSKTQQQRQAQKLRLQQKKVQNVSEVPVGVKLIFPAPVNCVLKIDFDANRSLRDNTARATGLACAKGLISHGVRIKLATHDQDGDACLITTDGEIKAILHESVNSPTTARFFVWMQSRYNEEECEKAKKAK